MAKFVDPKETLARVAAETKLKKAMDTYEFDGVQFFRQARKRRVQLLMKDGSIRIEVVQLATNEVVLCKDDFYNPDIQMTKLFIADVMDGEIIG